MLRFVTFVACMFGPSAVARADLKPFLDQFCVQCHGEIKPKAGLSLQKLTFNPVQPAEIESWKELLERVENGDMPPEKSKQPKGEVKQKFIASVRAMLKSAGATLDESRLLAPVRGNYLDHEQLFSGKPVDPATTNPRLWRISGQAYERFIQQKNQQFGLGIRTYGNDKIRSPWELPFRKEFSDYSSAHRIGDADIEYHLRNVTKVAQAMVKKFSVQKFNGPHAIVEFGEVVRAGKDAKPEQIQAAVVASFAKILNRKLEPADVERYATFWTKNLQAIDAEKAAEQFLLALLMRPDVMYRLELPAEPGERSILPPLMLARAISFALTDAEPDAVLRTDAETGKLQTRDDARRHVERLLQDRAIEKPHVLRFFQEYFGYTTAGDIFKDDVTLAEYGLKRQQHVPNVYVSDTDQLVGWVLKKDQQVLRELLTTPKTFVLAGTGETTRNLKVYAEHLRKGGAPRPPEPGKSADVGFGYRGTPVPDAVLAMYEIKLKIKDWYDDRPYDMPAEHRMGILTHPSWLISHTNNFDNHAIDRGRWIRERLLGGRVPEIPITVDATLPDEPHVPLRERMRVTRVEYCWNCHQYMDPLGLAFEHFDPFGRYRSQELVVDKQATEEREKKKGKALIRTMKNVPLDSSGEIAKSGDPKLDGPVKGPFEMIKKLANSERVEQVFVRHAFRFFLGRNETYADGPVLIAAHKAYRDSNGSMNALLVALLTSDSFLYRGK